ncbi:Os01g0357150 [Oryza sativa Japonica Group]|uniref:Os01g0357150 protein n=1 Tax=Oryza sativa subsp. japonica TaxID=39947 RepID=A0A0P0V2Z9_ORYSJ|nr:Os01g0357150 [Oryza sativa Japonica Group]
MGEGILSSTLQGRREITGASKTPQSVFLLLVLLPLPPHGPEPLDQDVGDDRRQLVARHGLLVRAGEVRVAADAAADEDVGRLNDLAGAVLGEAAHEADVGDLHLAAAVGAAGPVHPHRPGHRHELLHLRRHQQRPLLRLDDGLAAELVAGARDEALEQQRRLRGELLKQRLGEQRLHLLVLDVRDHDVLLHGEAELAGAVLVGEACELEHVRRLHPADGHVQADVGHPFLLLRVHAEVVPPLPFLVDEVLRRRALQHAVRHPLLHLRPKSLHSLLVDEPHHAGLLAVAPGAEVAVRLENGLAHRDDVVAGDPGVERQRLLPPLGAYEPADEEVEPELAALHRRHVREVVDVWVLVQIVRPDHAHVPLPRQVGDGGVALEVAGDVGGEEVGVGSRVDDLVGVDAGERVADGVADVVHAALEAGEADGVEPVEDGRHVGERDAADLPVLAGCHVGAALLAVRLDHARQVPRLLARRHTVWQLQPHHEPPILMLAAVEEAEPLEPHVDVLLGELVGLDLLHGHLGELLDAALHEQ